MEEVTDSGNNDYGRARTHLGGFARLNGASGEINRCYAKGVINENGQLSEDVHIGGFVQNNSEMIKDCYAKCEINSVTANSVVGGFASLSSKTISSCYAVAKITIGKATAVGGFIAGNQTNNTINASVVKAEIKYTSATNAGPFAGLTQSGSWFEKSHYSADCKLICGEEEVIYEGVFEGLSKVESEKLFSTELLVDSLRWDTTIWVIDGENAPRFIYEPKEEPTIPSLPDESESVESVEESAEDLSSAESV